MKQGQNFESNGRLDLIKRLEAMDLADFKSILNEFREPRTRDGTPITISPEVLEFIKKKAIAVLREGTAHNIPEAVLLGYTEGEGLSPDRREREWRSLSN